MRHVTFETAIRLKDAGFRPVDFFSGQVWFCRVGRRSKPTKHADIRLLSVCGASTLIGHDYIGSNGNIIPMLPRTTILKPLWDYFNYEDLYLAATATDILQQLGNSNVVLCFWDKIWSAVPAASFFEKSFDHENPAEACAAAWLAMHKK